MAQPILNAQSIRLSLLILVSAGFALLRSGPLHGTTVALGLTVILQLGLPGYLLARVLGKLRIGHPILRFAWLLVCGLSLTIIIGAAARALTLPVTTYLIGLHGAMLVLAWLPAGVPDPDRADWRFERRFIPLYLVLVGACLVGMVISYGSRYRFYGFEDQVIFASQAGWIANNPGENPHDLPYLRARRVGALNSRDSRFDTDGWTYNHAAWAWTSGVSAPQIIWYDLNPLFVWSVPLITFALAYELTRREQAATWAAASLTVVGLLTLDNIVHYPSYVAYGRMAVFQVNVLRQAAITVMLPLCLLVSLTYFRTRKRPDWLMMVLSGIALAIMHPIMVMLLSLSIGSTASLNQWLGRQRWLPVSLPILLALVIILTLPLIQRQNRVGSGSADTLINLESVAQEATYTPVNSSFIILPDVPLIGSTFILNLANVFYHPAILLAAILGFGYVIAVRRSLAAQFILGTTMLFWVIAFTPGLTALFNRVASSVGLLTSAFILPVALILGLALDALLRRLPSYPLLPVAAGIIGLGIVLLLEPVPITASPADQLQSFNEMQESRRLLPTHEKLAERLNILLPADQTSVVVAAPDTTSIIIENLPRTLVTGGRASSNRARFGDNRFFNLFGSNEPWLDSVDLDFMQQYGVTHIVIRSDETRTPQLALQPERFTWLDSVDGLDIFAWNSDVPADEIDSLFAEMNAQYTEIIQPRWGPEGFVLVRPGDADRWLPLVEQWEALLSDQPDNDRVRLGLAFAYLLAGDDATALSLWETLNNQYPDVAFYYDALAYTQHILGQPEAGFATLFAGLSSASPAVRALAADSLLTENFFYLLNADQVNMVIEVSDELAWDYLVFSINQTRFGGRQPC